LASKTIGKGQRLAGTNRARAKVARSSRPAAGTNMRNKRIAYQTLMMMMVVVVVVVVVVMMMMMMVE